MYCEKHKDEGNGTFRTGFSLDEYKRVMEAHKKIACSECRKEFLCEPKFRNMSLEQFLGL